MITMTFARNGRWCGNDNSNGKSDSNGRSVWSRDRCKQDSNTRNERERFDRFLGWNRQECNAISGKWLRDAPHLGHNQRTNEIRRRDLDNAVSSLANRWPKFSD